MRECSDEMRCDAMRYRMMKRYPVKEIVGLIICLSVCLLVSQLVR